MNHKQPTCNLFPILNAAKEFNAPEQARYILDQISLLKPLLFLLFLCHIPIALVWLEIIPFEYRFHALFFTLAGLAAHCLRRRYSIHDLGFRTDNLKSSLVLNLQFCAAGGIGLYLTYKAGIIRPGTQDYLPHAYLFYIFFLGPIQEIFYRGVLFSEIKRIQNLNNNFFLLISTFSFCFLHIIYRHPPLLFITFIGGLIWGIIFIKRPNIWGISLSHSLLGTLALVFNLI